MSDFSTEIRTFYSLKEIREALDEETNQLRILSEDYSEWLGTLLRNPKSSKSEEWSKKAAELQKALKAGGRKGGKKKEKTASSIEWKKFKEIMLCSDSFGEAEILFEAVEELRGKIEKLEKIKKSIEDLERYGLGKEMRYITYIKDGIPQKMIFKSTEESEAAEKFEFSGNFSVTKQT